MSYAHFFFLYQGLLRIIVFFFFKNKIDYHSFLASLIGAYLRNLFIMKISSLIAVRFCFGFQKFFIVNGFAINFFFILLLTLFQISLCFFNNSSLSIKNTSIEFYRHYNFLHMRLFLKEL